MAKSNLDATLPELPQTGKSRWRNFAPFCPVSRERFRQLVNAGRAPQPVKFSIRCALYDNEELHLWLKNPVNYQSHTGSSDE